MNQGPYLWRNWRDYSSKNAKPTFEIALYSDSNFTSILRRSDWPLDLLPTFPHPARSDIKLALVARVRWTTQMPSDASGESKTDERYFHGGGIDDEIASLLSLALGVRCRSGGFIRHWWFDGDEDKYDPFGFPVKIDHQPPIWIPPTHSKLVLPSLPEDASLDDAADLVEKLPQVGAAKSTALVRAAHLYANALWVAEADPNLAWLQLVSALEVGAVSESGTRPLWKRFAESMPEIWDELIKHGDNHAQKVGEKLAPLVKSTDRFMRFMREYQPDPPTPRDFGNSGQLDWSELEDSLGAIYGYRSRALHAGTPFPTPTNLSQPDVGAGQAASAWRGLDG